MDKPDTGHHPAFLWLLLWRGLLAVVALYVALEKPLSALFVSLGALGGLLLAGELAYRWAVYFEKRRIYEERQRELRQQRMEEAQRRYEQMKEARKGRRAFMLHDDEEEEQVAADAR